VEHARRPPQPLRLPARAGVGRLAAAVAEGEPVVVAGPQRDLAGEAAVPLGVEDRAAGQDARRVRRPDPELRPAPAAGNRSQPPQARPSSHTTASGGSTSSADHGCPCHGDGSASTPPRLPTLEPPYSSESVLSASRQRPPCGSPSR